MFVYSIRALVETDGQSSSVVNKDLKEEHISLGELLQKGLSEANRLPNSNVKFNHDFLLSLCTGTIKQSSPCFQAALMITRMPI